MNVRSFTLRVDSLLKEIITDVSVFDARYNDISSLNDPRFCILTRYGILVLLIV